MSASKITAIATFLSLFSSVYSAPSQACSQPQRSPIDWRPKANDTKIFQIGRDPDNPREIRVSVPPLYNGSEINLPLILAFHDKEQSPAEFEYATRFSDREINENKIVVYPKAVNVCHPILECEVLANSIRTLGNQKLQFEDGRRTAKMLQGVLLTTSPSQELSSRTSTPSSVLIGLVCTQLVLVLAAAWSTFSPVTQRFPRN